MTTTEDTAAPSTEATEVLDQPNPAAPEVPEPTDGASNDATPAEPEADEVDVFAQLDATPTRTVTRARTGNSQWAPESVRNKIKTAMAQLTARGFTRPSLIKATGMTDSQLWRAQNGKTHQREVPAIMNLIERVVNGDLQPPASRRKATVEDLEAQLADQQERAARALDELQATYAARIERVLEALAFDAKTTAQYRKVVEAAQEALRDLVTEPATA